MEDCFGATTSVPGVCLYLCNLAGPTTAPPGLGGCSTGETCQSSYQGQTINVGVAGVGLCIPNGGIQPPDAGVMDAGHDSGAADAGHDSGAADAGHDSGAIDAGHDSGAGDAGKDAGDGG